MPIASTTTVAAPAVTYNQWFITAIVGSFTPTSAPVRVTLRRSATVNNAVVLAPADVPGNVKIITVDVVAQMNAYPALLTAYDAIVSAVEAYATSKKLL
jgi:hypothetical protein